MPTQLQPALATEVLALETSAARAGTALACAYSNSAEFDAALIAERRTAGVYGPKRQRRQLLTAGAAAVAAIAAMALILHVIG